MGHAVFNRVSLAGVLALGGCYEGVADAVDAGADSAETEAGGGSSGGEGSSGGAEPDAPVPACGAVPVVQSRPLRRLTPTQYRNTMRDLLGDPEFEGPYDDVEATITEDGVREFRAGAEQAIANVDRWAAGLVPCDLGGAADLECPLQVVDTLAPRAFRRPLTDEERAWLLSIYEDTEAEAGFRSGMEALLGSILQAPAFAYLIETGTPLDSDPTFLALDDYTLASRLSYFLWDTMPDQALLDAAEAGELGTPAGLEAQVDRMLADPRTREKFADVTRGWFHLDGTEVKPGLFDVNKDTDLFPEHSFSLAFAMRREFEALVERTLLDAGDFSALFSSREAYVNASLAALYGVQGPADDTSWAWVELDPQQRAGLLTRAAFLTTYASPVAQSPIRRGVFVFEDLLCRELDDPPPNASDVPVDGGVHDGEVITVREEVELVTQGADCSGCHVIINNIGFAFEHYDALGRWQETELLTGLPIDTSGALVGSDVDGALADAVELSERLADSRTVQACFAERWFAEALGSELDEMESCSAEHALATFAETGRVRDLLVGVATSDAFRFIKRTEGGE